MPKGFIGRVQNVMQSLLPREHDFFRLFHSLADQSVRAAECLDKLLNDYKRLDLAVEQIDDIEHQADSVVHEIVRKLNATFVTPVLFDREDIYRMAETLDDIVDLIKGTIDRFKIFKIEAPDEHSREMSTLIVQATLIIHDTVRQLDGIRLEDSDFCAQVNALENEGDAALKRSLAELFETQTDAREIVKWKELYEFMEQTLDICEDIANLLENIIVKNA